MDGRIINRQTAEHILAMEAYRLSEALAWCNRYCKEVLLSLLFHFRMLFYY